MFPLRYNFSFRFQMWKTKGGNHKGLAECLRCQSHSEMCQLVYVCVCTAFRLRNGRNIYSRWMRLNFFSDFKMFPLRYNFPFRFLMWKTKGGNPKGLAATLVFPLLQSPFLNPAPPAALAQAPCSRKTVRGLQRLTAQTFYSFKLSSL